jgi:hypothetical protein
MANVSVSLLMYGLSVVRHPMMSPDGIAASSSVANSSAAGCCSSVAAGGKSPVLRKCRNHHYLFK